MASALQFRLACRALHAGGVVAYPTEAVWGLGCEPRNRHACLKLLHLKQRDWRSPQDMMKFTDYSVKTGHFTAYWTPPIIAAMSPAKVAKRLLRTTKSNTSWRSLPRSTSLRQG